MKKSQNKDKNRSRDMIWFNPPYSAAIRTNIGQEFLKLVTKSFPPGKSSTEVLLGLATVGPQV